MINIENKDVNITNNNAAIDLNVLTNLPSYIKILDTKYLLQHHEIIKINDSEAHGYIDYREFSINYTDSVVISKTVTTILHEILHGLFDKFDIRSKDEEHIVTVLANGLTTVMLDNPELFKSLQKALDRDRDWV